ncbi:DUF2164 domain-containing protein [Caulobacter zeae]|nr:DUF2164 domain-containing protein [Caulobacter zeae]
MLRGHRLTMARIELDKDVREAALRKLTLYMRDELDRPVSGLEAGFLLDFIGKTLGPAFFNQGVRDAQALILQKLDDVVYEIEKPV